MRRRGSGFGWFLIGAGIGLVFSAVAVALAAELTRRRYVVDLRTGEVVIEEYDPLGTLSEAVQGGMHLLAGAAAGVSETFSHALREKIRFGLDPQEGGGGEHAYYYEEE